MKLLLENWRKYLNERKSDIQYQKLVDFITELIKTEDVFDRYDAAERGELSGMDPHPKGAEFWSGWKAYGSSYERTNRSGLRAYRYGIGNVDEQLYKRYKAFVGQHDPLYSWISFYHFFSELSIRLIPELSHYGTMSLGKLNLSANHLGLIDPASHEREKSKELYKEWENADPKFIYDKYLRPASAYVKRILDHEITHWINRLRAWENQGHRVSAIDSKVDRGVGMSGSPATASTPARSPEYINSPDEVQARMIAAINLFKNVSPEYKKASFLNMDPRDFLQLFIVYYNEIDDPKWEKTQRRYYGKPKWWEDASEETKKKLIGRVLDTENGVFASLKRQWRQENETPP